MLFCGDKDKGLIPICFSRISNLRSSVAVTGNKVGFQVVSYINLLMNNVDGYEVSLYS